MADVTAPAVQTNLAPADVASTAPTTAPVHDQQIGPSVSPPQVTFPDDAKNTITQDLRAKALEADAAAQAARDPMLAIHKKLDTIIDMITKVRDTQSEHTETLNDLSIEEPTDDDKEFVADDDEEEEMYEGDDDDEEEEAVETADEAEDDDATSTKRTADDESATAPTAQRRKTRRH